MKLFYFATALLVALLSIVQVNAKGVKCAKHVVIERGDICYYIIGANEHKDYYVRLKDLKLFNPTMDCDNLRSGQKLCVEVAKNYEFSYDTYKIVKGDTCKSVANNLNTTVLVLQNLNNYLDCSKKNLNKQAGVEIIYHEDGKYEPNFKNSKKYPIIKA